MHTRTTRSPIGGLLATLLGAGVLLTAPSAQATQTFANNWNTRYPDSLSYDNAGCVLCHNTPSGTGGFNPYGIEVFIEGIAGAEPIDSDKDPGTCTNLEEINNDTQPAWTPPLPSYISPAWILGLLDPDPSLCGAPNTPPVVTNPGAQRDGENTTQSLQVVASDADGDTLSYSALGLPPGLGINTSSGLISGTISFTAVIHPAIVRDYNVEVKVSDGTDPPTTVSFVWTVDDLNRAPLAVNDSANTPEDTTLDVQVLANDSDADGDALTVTAVTDPLHGTTFNNGNDVTYTPDANYAGTDTFNYTVADGFGGSDTATVTMNVTAANDPPLVTNPGAQADTETDVVSVRIVATDVDGDSLTYSIVAPSTLPPVLTINPSTGVISGTVSYDAVLHPALQEVYPVTVAVSDGINPAVAVSFVWTIDDLNRDPVALDDSGTTVHDTAVTVQVLPNDSDADGDVLTVASVTAPANGTATSDGSTVTYVPDAGFVGTDSLTYTVDDGFGGSATATVTVDVTNEAPVAVNDVYSTPFETPLTVPAPGVLGNDSDLDGDALTAVQQSAPTNGTATLNADGSFTYTPSVGFTGTDSFVYRASDGIVASADATVSINVGAVPNRCPVVTNPGAQTNAETDTVSVQVVASDLDGDVLSYTATGLPPILMINPSTGEIMNVVSYDAVQHPDLSAVYPVSVSVSDGDCSTPVSFDWTVNDVNRNPVAADDAASTELDTPVTVAVLANDSDADGDALSVASVGAPLNGTAQVNADGTITYTPSTGFTGEDNFVYTVDDGFGGSAQATVTIMVSDLNRDPVAADDTATTVLDTPVTVDVLANDSDPDGDALSVVSVGAPSNGTAEINADDTITYTPNTGFIGEDSFVYTIEDGSGGSAQATVTITVNDVTGEADVYLTRINAPRQVMLQVDREVERMIRVFGDGDTIEQKATVKLKASDPDGLEVEIEPSKVDGTVVPGGPDTQFDFVAEIDCEKQGTYEIVWTATIKADQNADATNDQVQAVTTVVCTKKGKK